MGKRYKHLLEQISDIDNIRLAYKKAVKGGNRYTVSHLKFKENLEANLYVNSFVLDSGRLDPTIAILLFFNKLVFPI